VTVIKSISVTTRVAYVCGLLLILSGLIHFGILIGSGASWEGPLSFRKPGAFGLSFGVTLITLTWVSQFVRLGPRTRGFLIAAFTMACLFEATLVSMQAWRGVPSHFNVSTPFDARVAGSLAIGGAALVLVIVTLAIASFRRNNAAPISMMIAIRTGFVALVLAQAIGGLMIAKGMTLMRGGHPQLAYATGGTFKPMHAVTMHGIQLLPVAAWLLSYVDLSERQRSALVLALALGYLVVVIITTAFVV
jgi:hypothetical protein